MALSACEQAAADLAELLAARKALVMGQAPSSIRLGDKETRYNPANLDLLNAEIRRLQRVVDACSGRAQSPRMITVAPGDV